MRNILPMLLLVLEGSNRLLKEVRLVLVYSLAMSKRSFRAVIRSRVALLSIALNN